MLQLERISILQFKNYAHQKFNFEDSVVAISGRNGIGKTNLLDAIYYLSFTRSYFGGTDAAQTKTGSNGFRVDGRFLISQQAHEIQIILRENGKKETACDGILYEKFSDHIGKFPVVMIAPDDIELINGSPEIRRKFIDTILCQTDQLYLKTLIQYNKILQQRNSYLKQAAINRHRDNTLLDTLDNLLTEAGNFIYQQRKLFAPVFRNEILKFYDAVAGKHEATDFQYYSQLHNQSLLELLQNNREKDYLLQRTNHGIHKDNPEILLDEVAFKTRGSQGQKKSMLFALKLAESSFIEMKKGHSPILLLDDVFEKLDSNRMHNLLTHICHNTKAQIFLTDTHPERMTNVFNEMGKKVHSIHIDN